MPTGSCKYCVPHVVGECLALQHFHCSRPRIVTVSRVNVLEARANSRPLFILLKSQPLAHKLMRYSGFCGKVKIEYTGEPAMVVCRYSHAQEG
jgi:hypothetical protein